MTIPTPLAALALAAGLAAATSAQITAVDPVEGPHGTLLTIDGSGFGDKKPRVSLIDPSTGKKRKLKVWAADDGSITAEVRSGAAGTYDLRVEPKGAAPLVLTDAFAIRAPEIVALLAADGFTPLTEAAPDQELLVVGRFLGPKKGRVVVGGRKAKVLEWVAADPAYPDGGDLLGVARARMPKKLANGVWDVVLESKAGAGAGGTTLMMVGSAAKVGKPGLTVSIDGQPAKWKPLPVEGFVHPSAFVIEARTAKKPRRTLRLTIPYDMDSQSPPVTVPFHAFSLLRAELVELAPGDPETAPSAEWTAGLGFGVLDVTILAEGGGQVGGTIHAELPLQSNTLAEQKPVTVVIDGSFIHQP